MTNKEPSKLPKLGRLKFLLHDSALFGGATAIKHLATLVTFPIILRHLSVTEYGLLDFLQLVGAFLVILLVFGQESAVSRYFFEYEDKPTRIALISQSLALRLFIVLVAFPFLWIYGPGFLPFKENADLVARNFRILLLQVPCLILLNFAISILRITFSRYLFVSLSIGYSFFQAALWLFAILVLDQRVEGILIGSLVATGLCAAIGLFLVREWIELPRDFRRLKEMLPYAIPFGFVGCLESISPIIDRSLIRILLDAEALGYFAAGAKVAMLFTILAYAFQVAWNPFALAIHKSPTAGETYDQVLRLVTAIACFVALAIGSVAHPIVVLLASENFASASVTVFPLVMSFVVLMISWITGVGVNIGKRTIFTLYAFAIGLFVGVVAVFVLTSAFGIVGTAVGVLIGSAARTMALSYFAHRIHPIKYSTRQVVTLLLATAVSGTTGSVLYSLELTTHAIAINIFAMIGVILFAGTFLFSSSERKQTVSALKRTLQGEDDPD